MASYTDTPRATPRWRTVLATCATTLAVAAVAGLGIWQAGLHGHSSGKGAGANQVTTRATASQVTTQVPSRSVPASSAIVRPTQNSVAPQLILVGSADEAARLQRGFDAANDLRSQTGVGPLDDRILQVDGAGEANTATRAVADENDFRAVLGLPPITVIDLRQSAAPPAQLNRAEAGGVPFVMDRQ